MDRRPMVVPGGRTRRKKEEMKILVTLARTPQRDQKIRIDPDGRPELDEVPFEINPFDELAVEEAIRLREAGAEVEIVVVTVGPEAAEEQVTAALAMGADRALRVEPGSTEPLDHAQIAKALKAVVEREQPSLVLAGKLAVDDESGVVPSLLAALLDWPQASQASSVKLAPDGATARVTCEVDDGLEEVELDLPALVTADLRLNEPRYASLPGIMKAKRKPREVVSLADCGDVGTRRVRVTGYRGLPPRPKGVVVDSVAALLAELETRR